MPTVTKRKIALTPLRIAKLCREIAQDKKAENVTILDVRKISSLADFYVICTGKVEPHLKAIADEIQTRLRDEGIIKHHRDGSAASKWIVLDYVDVFVHIFHPKSRDFYALEELWKDAKEVK